MKNLRTTYANSISFHTLRSVIDARWGGIVGWLEKISNLIVGAGEIRIVEELEKNKSLRSLGVGF